MNGHRPTEPNQGKDFDDMRTAGSVDVGLTESQQPVTQLVGDQFRPWQPSCAHSDRWCPGIRRRRRSSYSAATGPAVMEQVSASPLQGSIQSTVMVDQVPRRSAVRESDAAAEACLYFG